MAMPAAYQQAVIGKAARIDQLHHLRRHGDHRAGDENRQRPLAQYGERMVAAGAEQVRDGRKGHDQIAHRQYVQQPRQRQERLVEAGQHHGQIQPGYLPPERAVHPDQRRSDIGRRRADQPAIDRNGAAAPHMQRAGQADVEKELPRQRVEEPEAGLGIVRRRDLVDARRPATARRMRRAPATAGS